MFIESVNKLVNGGIGGQGQGYSTDGIRVNLGLFKGYTIFRGNQVIIIIPFNEYLLYRNILNST